MNDTIRKRLKRKKFLGTIFVPLEVFRYNFCTIRTLF